VAGVGISPCGYPERIPPGRNRHLPGRRNGVCLLPAGGLRVSVLKCIKSLKVRPLPGAFSVFQGWTEGKRKRLRKCVISDEIRRKQNFLQVYGMLDRRRKQVESQKIVQSVYFEAENSVSLMVVFHMKNKIIFFTSSKFCDILNM
jgi:hypothetical protein